MRWGRRPIFICGCILQVIAQLLGVLAWNFSSYCASIFIGSICQFMVCITSFVMATEITDYGMRNFMGIATFYAYSTGYCIVALVGYLFQQWRWMLGFLMVLTALIYIPCCFLFPESPRWLAQKGESERAIELLRTIAKVNGRKENFENKLRMGGNHVVEKTDIPSTGTMDTLKVLFKSGIGGRFLAAVFGWSVTSMVYYAIAIYSTDFSSDRFINFFLAGVSEIPAFLMTFLLLKYIGRPRTNFALLLVSGFSSFVLPFIPKDLQLLSTVIALAGKISIAGVFYAWFLIACEMIPTLQRSSGVGICSAGARIGSFLAPYLMYTRKYNYFAPNIVMGISAVLSAWAGIFFVPETLGVEIPDTAEEAKQNRRFYGLKLGRKFLREKNADSNIKKTTNDIEERELML